MACCMAACSTAADSRLVSSQSARCSVERWQSPTLRKKRGQTCNELLYLCRLQVRLAFQCANKSYNKWELSADGGTIATVSVEVGGLLQQACRPSPVSLPRHNRCLDLCLEGHVCVWLFC